MTAILTASLAVVAVIQTVLLGVVVAMFLRRQKELEELALIESKERREYLLQASSRMAVQTDQMRKLEFGEMRPPEEFDPLSVANRRMREGRS